MAGVKLDAETVDLRSHTTASGVDFCSINPKGNVPTIVLDDGTILNENAATLQWIADQKPGSAAPAPGTPERYKIINWLSYIGSEVHPSVGGHFNPTLSPDVKAFLTARAYAKFDYLNKELTARPGFLGGSPSATIADYYLYIVLTWCPYVNLSLDSYPNLKTYFDTVGGLAQVKAALAFIATNPSKTTP